MQISQNTDVIFNNVNSPNSPECQSILSYTILFKNASSQIDTLGFTFFRRNILSSYLRWWRWFAIFLCIIVQQKKYYFFINSYNQIILNDLLHQFQLGKSICYFRQIFRSKDFLKGNEYVLGILRVLIFAMKIIIVKPKVKLLQRFFYHHNNQKTPKLEISHGKSVRQQSNC